MRRGPLGDTWAQVLQHRFAGEGEMRGHNLGNLLIVGLWEQLGDHVEALDWVGRLLGAKGRVLPMALVPMDIVAEVSGLVPGDPEARLEISGQVEVATTDGRIESIQLIPDNPPAAPDAVKAICDAEWVFLGPGSWFTSVLPHLMVRALREALVATSAKIVVVLNLGEQPGRPPASAPPSTSRSSSTTLRIFASTPSSSTPPSTVSRTCHGWPRSAVRRSRSPTSPSATAPLATTRSGWLLRTRG